MSEQGKFDFSTLRFISSWVDNMMYCKDLLEISSNHDQDTNKFNGSFRITHSYSHKKAWTTCSYFMELPEIISHYLNLNLIFVKPTSDFDGTLGWQNETYSSGPLKMISNNKVDFIINEVITTENIWNPKLYQMSTALLDEYTINFVFQKQIIKTSISDYFKAFNLLTWIIIFLSIILV